MNIPWFNSINAVNVLILYFGNHSFYTLSGYRKRRRLHKRFVYQYLFCFGWQKYEDKYKSLDHKMKLYKLYTHTKSYKGMYIFHGLELGYDMEISIYCLLNMAKGVTILIFMPPFSPITYRRQLSRQWSILAIIW